MRCGVPWLLAGSLALIPVAPVWAAYNPFTSAMQAMADAMANYADRGKRENNWRQGAEGRGWDRADLFLLYRNMPGAPPRSPYSRTQIMDGIWQGRHGEVLMIKDSFFRVFTVSYNVYEDGALATQGPYLRILNPRTGETRDYEYAQRGERMILRDDEGNLLLYRRLELNSPPSGGWLP